jgi:predicted RNA-binding protein with PUA-like domain
MSQSYWLFKQEPATYSYWQLEKDGKTIWDGVANNLAQKHLRNVRKGDKVLFYHTGGEKQAVGIMEAISDPYPQPDGSKVGARSHSEKDSNWPVVVQVKPVAKLPEPVGLQKIKSDPAFASWELVRIPRLSVMPVPPAMWKRLMEMAHAGSPT